MLYNAPKGDYTMDTESVKKKNLQKTTIIPKKDYRNTAC